MKKILFVLCLGLVFVSCSEKRVLVDDLVKKDNELNLHVKTFYYNSKPFNGIGFDLHSNGEVSKEMNFKEGIPSGLYKKWYENGQLKWEENYISGRKDGMSKKWYGNGQLQEEVNYKDGQPDGLYKMWYENGQLQLECTYKKSNRDKVTRKDGVERCWDENGQLKWEENYINGLTEDEREELIKQGINPDGRKI